MEPEYTREQGLYLAFIYYFTKVHGCPPEQADVARHFRVSGVAVHEMLLTMARAGLIERVPGESGTVRVRLDRETFPHLG